jgi:hypothetical protein
MDTPEPQAGAPADTQGLAAEILAGSDRDLHKPGPAASGPSLDAVDAYGRPWDPALHLAKRDGTPARSRAGRLICLPGQQLSGAPKVKASPSPAAVPAPGVGQLDLEGAGLGETSPTAMADAAAAQAVAAADAQRAAADAASGAELITDLTETLAILLAGDKGKPTDQELSTRQTRWSRWMEANALAIPFARFGQAVFAEGKYLARVSRLPEAKERLDNFTRWLTGAPPRPKVQEQQPQGQAGPAPAPAKKSDIPQLDQSQRGFF